MPYWRNPRYALLEKKPRRHLYFSLNTIVYVHANLLQSFLTFVTLRTLACQALLSMGFSRQEYWSGLPWSPPGNLLDPGVKNRTYISCWQADSLQLAPPWKPYDCISLNTPWMWSTVFCPSFSTGPEVSSWYYVIVSFQTQIAVLAILSSSTKYLKLAKTP